MRMFRLAVPTAVFLGSVTSARAQVGEVKKVAPDVYFHQGDIDGKGHCNNGWVVFEDYVLVIDANFPSGAKEVIPKIRALTNKPIRFAFDTHHHGDHAYGNQVWVDEGATPVAHTGVVEEMKKYETGLFGGKPGRWEDTAKRREDVKTSKLKPPSVLFPDTLIFDDGVHRVELRHLGVAHTHGDGFAWLPKEKILFTGDFNIPAAGLPVSPAIATLVQNVDRLKLDFDRHVIVHPPNPDRPLTKADLLALAKGTSNP
jgi:cyclase